MFVRTVSKQTAVVSLGNTKQPLPGFQGRSVAGAAASMTSHGELADNVALAASMPEVRQLHLS